MVEKCRREKSRERALRAAGVVRGVRGGCVSYVVAARRQCITRAARAARPLPHEGAHKDRSYGSERKTI